MRTGRPINDSVYQAAVREAERRTGVQYGSWPEGAHQRVMFEQVLTKVLYEAAQAAGREPLPPAPAVRYPRPDYSAPSRTTRKAGAPRRCF